MSIELSARNLLAEYLAQMIALVSVACQTACSGQHTAVCEEICTADVRELFTHYAVQCRRSSS